MKNNKGFIGLGLILAIIAVLVVGGGAYYLGTKKVSAPQNVAVDNLQSVEVKDLNNKIVQDDSSIKTYKNTEAGYSISYPSNWFFSKSSSSNIVDIQNMKVVNLPVGGWKLKDDGTQIQIEVTPNMNYKDIAEFTKDPKWMLPQASIADRLARDTDMTIGGQNLLVELYMSSRGQNYDFVYNGKLYKMSFSSGSDTQYSKDLKIFTDLLASFLLTEKPFTNSETSSTEVFNNQPGAIKSITDKDNNQWMLAVDLLSRNPKWLPGVDSTGGFFVNQNTKVRNLNVTNATKTYNCGTGPDGNESSADVLQNTSSFISAIQADKNKGNYNKEFFGPVRYFDINGTNITAIYEQCLP